MRGVSRTAQMHALRGLRTANARHDGRRSAAAAPPGSTAVWGAAWTCRARLGRALAVRSPYGGGTALLPFLKQARDETGEPAIDDWARRLLNNGPGHAARADADVGEGLSGGDGWYGGARMTKMGEKESGEIEIVGLAGTWSVDDSEGGICHW